MPFDFSVLNNFLSVLFEDYSREEWNNYLKTDPRVCRIVKVLNEWNISCIGADRIQKIDLSEDDFEYLASPFLETMRKLEGRKVSKYWLGTIGVACQEGPLECVQWMINNFPLGLSSEELEELFRQACSGGRLEIVKWLKESYPNLINIRYDRDRPFRTCCSYGQLKLAKWLLETYPTIDIFAINFQAFDSACAYGNLKTAKWLYNLALEYKYEEASLLTVLSNALEEAVYRGRLEILKWILKLMPEAITTQEDFDCYFEMACDTSNIDIAQWLCKEYPQFKPSARLVAQCLVHSSNRGRLNLVKWLVETFDADVTFRDYQAHRNALINRHFELASYLISKSPLLMENLTFEDPS